MGKEMRGLSLRLGDIPVAFGVITRLPVQVDPDHAKMRGAACVWAFPLVGLLVGLSALGMIWFGHRLGLPPLVVGALGVGCFAALTGAMHEDGFADCLDGFWGGWTKTSRLEIMKDSHIGVYGVVGLGLALVMRAALMGALSGSALWGIVGIAIFSRAIMTPAMGFMPAARKSGLSVQVGTPPKGTVVTALALGAGGALLFCGLIPILAMILGGGGMALLAWRKIGGQTGDVLGAIQQSAEIAGLLALIVVL